MRANSAAVATSDLEPRFRVTQVLPILILAFVLGALVVAGAPWREPTFSELSQRLSDRDWGVPVAGVLGSILVALVFRPLQVQLVRVLEGYWDGGRWQSVARYLTASQIARREVLEHQRLAANAELKGRIDENLKWYPRPGRTLPTRLGNILRSAEDQAGQRYGLETTVVWPRLYPLLSDVLREQVNRARDELDSAARLAVGLAFLAVVGAGLLVPNGGWWRALPAAFAVLSVVSYRAACASARYYGLTIYTAFDLHRFDLIEQLRIEVPSSPHTEFAVNATLSTYYRQHAPHETFPLRYVHPSVDSRRSS
jgi:hypothetical protein